jgi:hypothetical protein
MFLIHARIFEVGLAHGLHRSLRFGSTQERRTAFGFLCSF